MVVPVYNEGENVVPTLRGIVERSRTRPLEVLVVYDFDGDTTVPVVERLQSEIPELQLHKNTIGRGVLNAIKSGLAAARAPYVLVTMGDGSDDAGDIDSMYALAKGGADVVAGSRYMRGGHQLGGPLLKRSMSRAAGPPWSACSARPAGSVVIPLACTCSWNWHLGPTTRLPFRRT